MEELGYLGDGVYLSFDGFQYWLAANHHENKVIALEPNVLNALFHKTKEHQKRLIAANYNNNNNDNQHS